MKKAKKEKPKKAKKETKGKTQRCVITIEGEYETPNKVQISLKWTPPADVKNIENNHPAVMHAAFSAIAGARNGSEQEKKE
jgi:hypothetical protein